MTIDPYTYLYGMGLFFAACGLFVAYMAHRERLREEAEEADDEANRTAAE